MNVNLLPKKNKPKPNKQHAKELSKATWITFWKMWELYNKHTNSILQTSAQQERKELIKSQTRRQFPSQTQAWEWEATENVTAS